MIGIAADRLLPAAPWQAAQVTDLTAPRSSSGPAASAVTGGRTPGREPSRSPAAMTRQPNTVGTQALLPDASPAALMRGRPPRWTGPSHRALGDQRALGRRELLLDLH